MRHPEHASGRRASRAPVLFVALASSLAAQAPRSARKDARWLATWATADLAAAPRPANPDSADHVATFVDCTVRVIVHTSIGGTQVRVRFSNAYGDRPLLIDAAHVGVRDTAASIRRGTDRGLTFGGAPSIVIRPGAVVTSDGVGLDVPANGDLAISLYLPDSARAATVHPGAYQTNYVSAAGDESARETLDVARTYSQWPFVAGVDVENAHAAGVVVAFGNSITDGLRSTPNANARWPNVLAARVSASPRPIAVVDEGISGNRVLAPGTGPSALERFDRDVIALPGATQVILLEGINDILHGTNPADPRDTVSADAIIFGLRQLADRAHEHGIAVIGATLTPIGGLARGGPDAEAKVERVNRWIRTSGTFDGVVDFNAVTRDPAHPDAFLPRYDSGDHLHPNDAGYRAMGEAIPAALLRRTMSNR